MMVGGSLLSDHVEFFFRTAQLLLSSFPLSPRLYFPNQASECQLLYHQIQEPTLYYTRLLFHGTILSVEFAALSLFNCGKASGGHLLQNLFYLIFYFIFYIKLLLLTRYCVFFYFMYLLTVPTSYLFRNGKVSASQHFTLIEKGKH